MNEPLEIWTLAKGCVIRPTRDVPWTRAVVLQLGVDETLMEVHSEASAWRERWNTQHTFEGLRTGFYTMEVPS